MMKAAVFFADGFEEVEALMPVDLLRRAGVEVTMVGVSGREVVGARGVTVVTDLLVEEFAGEVDLMVFPGGMPGAANLAASQYVLDLIPKHLEADKPIGAICAAPAVLLGQNGYLDHKEFTCYPAHADKVPLGKYSEDPVVTDGLFTTSRGVGTAADFSLKLIALLMGEDKAQEIAKVTLLA
jgi:4-methyl-5(b-hydroxyethyl)-thiazole monophosphate biosynthesis